MPSFTIYVLGDTASFYGTLNGVAMIFNQTGFMNAAYVFGALVTLLSGILFLISRQSDGNFPGTMGPVSGFFSLAIIITTSSIPATTYVQDIYTGSTVKIDNVPLIIALPASGFTTAAYKTFDFTSTAMQSVNGSYMPVSINGVVTPLKLLFSLRSGFERNNINLATSIKAYILDCVPGSDTFSIDDFRSSSNFINYITTHGRDAGLTTYWSTANPQGVAASCSEAATYISQEANTNFLAPGNASLTNLINANVREKNPNGGAFTVTDVETVYQNIIPMNWQAAQSAKDFMLNALAYNTVSNTFNCLGQGTQSDFQMCNIQMTQAFEQSRSDSAAAGSFFAKQLMPAIVFMQLMFFGFAPIIVIYGLMKGGGVLGMYFKYLLFGIWTSSWLPFAAVIQMYIQNDVAEKIAQITEAKLTYGNFSAIYYDILASRLGLAADMLAATPLVSLALLSGSVATMTSLANRWSGRDHVDETQSSPNLLKNGEISSSGPMAQFGPGMTGNHMIGRVRNDAPLTSYSMSQALDSAVSSSESRVASSRAELAKVSEQALSFMKSNASGIRSSHGSASEISNSYANRISEVRNAVDTTMKELALSDTEQNEVRASVEAKAGFSSPFGGIQAAASAAATVTKGRVSAERFQQLMSKTVQDDKSWSTSMQTKIQDSLDSYSGSEKREAQTLSDAIRRSSSDVNSAEQAYQQSVSAKASLGGQFNVPEDRLGGMLAQNPAAQDALAKSLDSHRSDGRFAQVHENQTARLSRAGALVGSEQLAGLATLRALGDDAGVSKVLSLLSGMNGPTGFAANANSNLPGAPGLPNSVRDSAARPSDAAPRPGGGAVPGVPSGHGPAGNQAELKALTSSAMPGFDSEREARQAKFGDHSARMAAQREGMTGGPHAITGEDARGMFHREVGNVRGALAGAGAAWDDFKQAHPIAAGAIEIGATLIPVGRAVGGVTKLLEASGAAKAAFKTVETAKSAVVQSGERFATLDSAFRSQGGALLGGAKKLDMRRVSELGFSSEAEFTAAHAAAREGFMSSQKELARAAGSYAKEYGSQTPGFGWMVSDGAKQAGAVGKAGTGAAFLSLSQYEANIQRQEQQRK